MLLQEGIGNIVKLTQDILPAAGASLRENIIQVWFLLTLTALYDLVHLSKNELMKNITLERLF